MSLILKIYLFSISKSITEIDEMLEKDLSIEDSKILKATKDKLSSMVFDA